MTLRQLNVPSLDPEILLHQALTWYHAESYDRAETGFREVLAADPSNADAICHLGLIAHMRHDGKAAERAIRSAIALEPGRSQFHVNLAAILIAQGDHDGGISAYRDAIAMHPDHVGAHAGLVFAGDLHPGMPSQQRLADRRALNARHYAALTAMAEPHNPDRDPERPLRVGYVSADFRFHSASTVFSIPILNHTDAVIPYAYYQKVAPDDPVTDAFKARIPNWVEVRYLEDDALAQRIRADQIDILVDLSGYSAGHRVGAMARKPAPIIATGWGHVTGIGIDAVDHILADDYSIQAKHRQFYHEQPVSLPCVVSYLPHGVYPQVAEPPSRTKGYVTFGYLGRARKTSAATWAAWAQILRRVPNSRLILKAGEYDDPTYRRHVETAFRAVGVDLGRVDIRTGTPQFQHYSTYGEVDIALEPFPPGGGVTTLEGLMMGVPHVALAGEYINARIASSILRTAGLYSCVTETVDDYVQRAVEMAAAPRSIQSRIEVREALFRSVICDPVRYTEGVERAYREMWHLWLDRQRGAL